MKSAFEKCPTVKNGRPAVITNLNPKGNSTVSVKKSNVKVSTPTMPYNKINSF